MKSLVVTFKDAFSEKAGLFKSETKSPDKILLLEIILIILLIFLKVYINGLYVAEKSKISELRYRIKSIESETKRVRVEIAKHKGKDRLAGMSRSLNVGENIEVVVVR